MSETKEQRPPPTPEVQRVIREGVTEIEAELNRVRWRTAAQPGVEQQMAEIAVWTAMSLVVTERIWQRSMLRGGPDPEKVLSHVERYTQALVRSILNGSQRFLTPMKDSAP